MAGQDRDRQQRCIGGARLADGQRGDRNPLGHLDNGEQGIDALQAGGRHGHRQHRQDRLGGDHSRQMRRTAGSGNDDLQSPRLGLLGILKKPVGGAVCRNDPRFVGDGELPQQVNARKKDFVVALASHDHANGRRGVHLVRLSHPRPALQFQFNARRLGDVRQLGRWSAPGSGVAPRSCWHTCSARPAPHRVRYRLRASRWAR